MAWLVEHVAGIIAKYLRGTDGRTAHERLFGKQIYEEGFEFGERVLWKKRQSKDMNVLLEARWMEGLWLGRCWGIPNHSICDSDSVWEARVVQRCPEVQRWQPDLLGSMRTTPWPNQAPDAGEDPPEFLPPLPASERAPAPVSWQVPRMLAFRQRAGVHA